MTAKAFRDQYYPLPDTPAFKPKYSSADLEKWNRQFIGEFHRIRCTGEQHYNENRNREQPVWQTVCRMNGVGTWRQLLERLGLDTYKPERPALRVTIKPPENGE